MAIEKTRANKGKTGEVVLRNLKLKREALDKLDLPVDVLEGICKRHGSFVSLLYLNRIAAHRSPRRIDPEYTMVKPQGQARHGVH